jgi:hypothetical protein
MTGTQIGLAKTGMAKAAMGKVGISRVDTWTFTIGMVRTGAIPTVAVATGVNGTWTPTMDVRITTFIPTMRTIEN